MDLEKKEELIPMDDTFWDKMEERIAKRPFLDKCYWWCYHKINPAYWFIRTRPYYIYVRVTKGYNYKDLWSLDIPIAKFIYPRLRDYRKNVNGHPAEFYKEGDESDDGHNQWLEIIDKM